MGKPGMLFLGKRVGLGGMAVELHRVRVFLLKIVHVFLPQKKNIFWNSFSVCFLMASYFVGGKGD